MKKYLLLLALFAFALATCYAQSQSGVPARYASDAKQITSTPPAKKDTANVNTSVIVKAATKPASEQASTATTNGVAAKPAATTTKSTTASTSTTRKHSDSKKGTPTVAVKPPPAPSPYTMLSFVVNRGRVFAPDAPGELTSIRLSGYHRTDADSTRSCISEAAINEFSSVNSLTLTGRASINSDNSGKTTASAILCPLSAPQGLTLTLTVDGEPLSVTLPFVSSDRRWRSGYKYLYTVTVTGGALVVEGVTPLSNW